MSLTFGPRLARNLLGSFGLEVTFARTTPGTLDPIANERAPGAPITWRARAGWTRNDSSTREPLAFARGTSERTRERTLLVAGKDLASTPVPGDRVTVEGRIYSVGAVTPVGDFGGGTVPAFRLEVSA